MATVEQEAARTVIVRRFQEIAQAYDESLKRQKGYQDQAEFEGQQQQALIAVANDCHAAARVMNFDLIAALASFNAAQANATIHAAPPQQIIAAPKPISDLVLLIAENVYPEPVRAAALELRERRHQPRHHRHGGAEFERHTLRIGDMQGAALERDVDPLRLQWPRPATPRRASTAAKSP